MRIGIDASYLNLNFDGGKDQYLFNLLKGFEDIGVGENFTIFCLEEMKDKVKEIIPSADIKIVKFEKFLGKKTLGELIFRSFYFRKIKSKENIDLLFFPKSYTGFLKTDAKSIMIPHDIQTISRSEKYSISFALREKFFYYLDFKLRDRIIAISDFDREEMETYFLNFKNKIIRQYNPIRIEKKIKGKEKKEKYIIGINIMHGHKNILTLIKAFENIKDEVPHNLYLVGKINEYGKTLVEYVKENKLEDRVIFKGFVSDEELGELLENSSLYVNSTLFEGFGMTAVEAMIKCVPTIVSNVTANHEVTKGLCQYYQDPMDSEELGRKILKTLENKVYFDRLSEISNVMYEEYNYKKIAKDYYNLFKNI
ncbi:glycosyltransferase family 4 protein [Fusobacterium sp. MFO224]|uniref:glycosyltransferase family 4 protein n=1 Tax=Fusobacterium sp. MFO224 TaxID=3378070 RepID=UPI003852CA23